VPYYNEKQIEQARDMDLLTYLRYHDPTELIHLSGGVYTTRTHDSLKISNGKWMWWPQGIGGASALDYLIKVKGYRFTQAVGMILGTEADKFALSEKKKIENKERKARQLEMNEGHLYPKRICECCGKEYWPTKHHQKYCSKLCGSRMYSAINAGRDLSEKEGYKYYMKTCAICGKEFWPTGAAQLTCSTECQKKRISNNHKESYLMLKESITIKSQD